MSKTDSMNAIRCPVQGGAEELVYGRVPEPVPKAGEVLVEVHAAGVTPTEFTWPETWHDANGEYRLPIIPSHEVSGVVVQIAADVDNLRPGQEVYGLTDACRDGAAAEYLVARANELAPKPHSIDHVHAAAMPLSGLTAWQAFRIHASIRAGQRVLIHGGAGGVGSYAVQLAKYFGAETIVTCSALNADFVKRLGADRVIEYPENRFEEAVNDVDLVLDTVGGDTLDRSWKVLRSGGRLVSVADKLSQEQVARPGITALFFIVEPNRGHLIELANLVDDGALRPIVSKIFPLEQAREAYQFGLRGHMRGKIVLRVR